MADLLGDPAGLIPSDQLYRCLDKLLARLPQLEAKNNTNPLIYRPWG
jgi:hypothetical protein